MKWLVMSALVGAMLAPVVGADEADGPENAQQTEHPEQMRILGWVENVALMPEGIVLEAKMDTGATTSSLNALNKETFERDGKEWIAFDMIDPNDESNMIRLEREITRHVRIIRHSGNHQRRPVVEMGLCMGDVYRKEEVSLIDRTALSYQLLVGRNHMAGAILLDSRDKYLQAPDCDLD